jgi:hypothetical protein
MAPGPHTYFDMKESRLDTFGHWWAGIVPLSKVYAFDPLARDGLSEEAKARVLGVHGCLWTSQFRDDRTVEQSADYRTWPRLCALAEVGWTAREHRDLADFEARLGRTHLQRLAALGIGYRMPEARATLDRGVVVIEPPLPGAVVRYTTDGHEPGPSSPAWTGTPLRLSEPGEVRTRVFGPGDRVSHLVKGVVTKSRETYPLAPVAKTRTTMPTYGGHKPEHVVDWNGKTFFWSSRKGRAGDTFTMTFDEPLDLKQVEVMTGKLNNPNEDNVVDGELLVSPDGQSFEPLARFTFGSAKAAVKESAVQAVQIRLNADHDTWIIVQDPVLTPVSAD